MPEKMTEVNNYLQPPVVAHLSPTPARVTSRGEEAPSQGDLLPNPPELQGF